LLVRRRYNGSDNVAWWNIREREIVSICGKCIWARMVSRRWGDDGNGRRWRSTAAGRWMAAGDEKNTERIAECHIYVITRPESYVYININSAGTFPRLLPPSTHVRYTCTPALPLLLPRVEYSARSAPLRPSSPMG